jgi:hypothetical protein
MLNIVVSVSNRLHQTNALLMKMGKFGMCVKVNALRKLELNGEVNEKQTIYL